VGGPGLDFETWVFRLVLFARKNPGLKSDSTFVRDICLYVPTKGPLLRVLLPPYLVEELSQAFSFFQVDTFNEGYPALQMFTKVGMRFKVLGFWRVAHAICKCRLQHIEVVPPHIESLIGYQASQVLACRLAHDPRLAVLDSKALLAKNGCDMSSETFHTARKAPAAGESKVVGVTRVGSTGRLSEPA
jgi:hypothetical protein